MEFVFYARQTNHQKEILLKKIIQITKQTPDLACDFDALFKIIKQKISEPVIIIFLISCAEELDFLSANKALLFNSRLIVILPDEKESSISKGFSLIPRYIAYMSHDFKDVSAVLKKMIQYYASRE